MASKNDKLEQQSFEDIKPRLKSAVESLQNASNYSTQEVTNALECLADYSTKSSSLVTLLAEYVTNLGYAQLFNKMYKSLKPIEYLLSRAFDRQAIINLLRMQNSYWNYTDKHPQLGENLGKHGGIRLIFQCLSQFCEHENAITNLKDWKLSCIEGVLGILHNSIRLVVNNRPIYRQASCLSILTKYLKSADMLIKVEALLVMSYVANDSESAKLQTADGCVGFLTGVLKNAVQSEDHQTSIGNSGFSALELLGGLKQLSVNDANKKEIVKQGGVAIITRMLQSDFSVQEQTLAAETLWILAFLDLTRKDKYIRESTKCKYRKLASYESQSLK